MATTNFRVKEHTIPTSYIREYPRATAENQEAELLFAIKQYVPFESVQSSQEQITVIGAHANGFPKELYEPLWDDLYDRLKYKNIHISSIWIADCSHQGESGVLNEAKMGNDPSWLDYSRDMFLMINHFRKHMRRPLVGIAHSMGGCAIVNLALMHPRLFTTLILIDPVIIRRPDPVGTQLPARASTRRRDRWPSRKEAEVAFKRAKFYQQWDPRVLDRWTRYGLRELPTFIHPQVNTSGTLPIVSADHSIATVQAVKGIEQEVTLKTTKHQEVFTFLRPTFTSADAASPSSALPKSFTHPDLDAAVSPGSPFYRAEPLSTLAKLPHLRPSAFYIYGDESALSAPQHRANHMALTGTGSGGSGGVAQDRVGCHTFHGVGHLIPMEIVPETANACSSWIVREMARWRELEDAERDEWAKVPYAQRSQMSEVFVEKMMGDGANAGSGEKSKPKL